MYIICRIASCLIYIYILYIYIYIVSIPPHSAGMWWGQVALVMSSMCLASQLPRQASYISI
jgi:hypothetical protein